MKQTKITLSLDCMMKGARPSAMQGSTTEPLMRKFSFLMRSTVFLPQRKPTTHRQDTHWERMVARAAPFTPMCRAKIKMGSRTMLQTAPIATVSMPILAKPWAVIKAFMPKVSCTKIVPMA